MAIHLVVFVQLWSYNVLLNYKHQVRVLPNLTHWYHVSELKQVWLIVADWDVKVKHAKDVKVKHSLRQQSCGWMDTQYILYKDGIVSLIIVNLDNLPLNSYILDVAFF